MAGLIKKWVMRILGIAKDIEALTEAIKQLEARQPAAPEVKHVYSQFKAYNKGDAEFIQEMRKLANNEIFRFYLEMLKYDAGKILMLNKGDDRFVGIGCLQMIYKIESDLDSYLPAVGAVDNG